MSHSQDPSEAERLCEEGYAFLEAGRVDEAAARLHRALELAPTNPLIHYRLGLLFSDTGRPAEAVKALDAVVALQPDNARAHNNRGSALQLLGRNAEAETAFRRALTLAPHLDLPYVNLGKLLEHQGKLDQAVELYKLALANGLDAPVFRHYLAAASGQVTDRAPAGWVRDTFDNFAPLFDERLRDLQYDAPRQLAALVQSRTAGPLDILDVGCGTGQCGIALAMIRRRLVGIDLSEKMLARAREHRIYDELHAVEMQTWLSGAAAESFDLVIAGDVFVYVGDLESTFRDVARILRRRGLFAFSTEECSEADYTLLSTGRYAQSHAYISRLAQTSFSVVDAQPTVVRKESGKPLAGRLFLLERR